MTCNGDSGKTSRAARLLVSFNNWRTGRKTLKMRPENLLLLLPRCLQFSDCPQNVVKDIANCKRCGKCRIKDLAEIAEEFKVPAVVANGGRVALARVLDRWVHGVVAVACEMELRTGILSSPKPVLAVVNLRPNGPCTDTDVDLWEVRSSIRRFIGDQ
ncbi:MAG: DUF116 domain-containing protein [Thermodesulfobacteriota bacterium]